MPSEDTLKRIQVIKTKIEEVGDALGIPHEQAAALVMVDAIEQNTRHADSRHSAFGKVWAWFKGWMAHGSETAKGVRIE